MNAKFLALEDRLKQAETTIIKQQDILSKQDAIISRNRASLKEHSQVNSI